MRFEEAYSTWAKGRLTQKELMAHGITSMVEANRYLRDVYLDVFNNEFKQAAQEEGTAFIPWVGGNLDDILCEQYERTVTPDNCVNFETLSLQIPADQYRCHYVRVKVKVHRYLDGALAVYHGPRRLACSAVMFLFLCLCAFVPLCLCAFVFLSLCPFQYIL